MKKNEEHKNEMKFGEHEILWLYVQNQWCMVSPEHQ